MLEPRVLDGIQDDQDLVRLGDVRVPYFGCLVEDARPQDVQSDCDEDEDVDLLQSQTQDDFLEVPGLEQTELELRFFNHVERHCLLVVRYADVVAVFSSGETTWRAAHAEGDLGVVAVVGVDEVQLAVVEEDDLGHCSIPWVC